MAEPPLSRHFTVPASPDPFAIPLPFDPKAVFGSARAPVMVEINGHRFRSTTMTMKGLTFVPLRASHRAAAGVVAGHPFAVTLTLDTEPRIVDPPADLRGAIAAAGLDVTWAGLSFTDQREQAEAVAGAKRPETRARRIAAALAMLEVRRDRG